MKEYKGFLVDDDLNIYNASNGCKLTPFLGTDGYYQVARRIGGRKSYHIRVHRLYAILFIPNPNNYKYINHIDSNKQNNELSNLEWCTNSYNVKHGWNTCKNRHQNNTKVYCELNGEIKYFNSIRSMCEEINLDRHKVSRILKGEIKNNYEYSFGYL